MYITSHDCAFTQQFRNNGFTVWVAAVTESTQRGHWEGKYVNRPLRMLLPLITTAKEAVNIGEVDKLLW